MQDSGVIMAETQWEEAFSQITKLSNVEISNLCHAVADQICHNQMPAPDVYLKSLSLDEWWEITGALRKFFTSSARADNTKDEMLSYLKLLPENQRLVIAEAACVHREALRQHLLKDTTSISQSVLRDFDWQLKLVMSSDKLASINEPLLNLDLDLQEGSGNSRQVAVELSQQDVKKLIASLESCNKAVQQLTV